MASRLPRFESRARPLFFLAVIFAASGIAIHGQALFALVLPRNGFDLSINNAASIIGLELAVIGLLASIEPTLRGTSGGLLLLATLLAVLMGSAHAPGDAVQLVWQIRAHILIALLSYGLLTVGALVAMYMLVLERRLHAARLSPVSRLFAPLETTEKLLIGITATGFAGLTLAIVSGLTFVNDLVAQHLAHKFSLSLLAWLIFGTLGLVAVSAPALLAQLINTGAQVQLIRRPAEDPEPRYRPSPEGDVPVQEAVEPGVGR